MFVLLHGSLPLMCARVLGSWACWGPSLPAGQPEVRCLSWRTGVGDCQVTLAFYVTAASMLIFKLNLGIIILKDEINY